MQLHFVCFARGELLPLPLNRVRFSLPDPELVKQADVRLISRADNPDWFADWWQKALGVYARSALGQRFDELTESDSCTSIRLETPDRADLVPLQTSWAIARWCVERGAAFVLDFAALRFRTGEEVSALSPERLDIQREVQLVVEVDAESDAPEGLLMHSRGMCKFARPDVLVRAAPADRNLLAQAVNRIAQAFADGLLPERVRLRLAPEVELVTMPSKSEERGLTDVVELVRADGRSLAGIAAELARLAEPPA